MDPGALPLCMGSHLDTQPTGGRFDGVLGVLSALEVFCPCVGGISHNESEEISPEWAGAGTNVLLHTATGLARAAGPASLPAEPVAAAASADET